MDSEAARRLVEVLRSPDSESDSLEPLSPTKLELPGYEISGLLGEGGGGQVWRARWLGSARVVALKILRHRLGEGQHAERAWRELALLDELRIPCVPSLLDYGVHEGRMYFATELIEGQDIEEHAATHALGLHERVELLERVAGAVGELHARGVLHRDLKPSNILITPTGDPVIIDLGVAFLVTDDPVRTLTAEGAPVGTPAFMAPEQARGEREAVGTWSDTYALGAVGYLLLTGSPPHDLSDATLYEAVRRVGQDTPRDPTELSRSLPRPLAAVLQKA